MRQLLRDARGEVTGERWTLTPSDVGTVLAALDVQGASNTLGAGMARSLAAELRAGEPKLNGASVAPSSQTR